MKMYINLERVTKKQLKTYKTTETRKLVKTEKKKSVRSFTKPKKKLGKENIPSPARLPLNLVRRGTRFLAN